MEEGRRKNADPAPAAVVPDVAPVMVQTLENTDEPVQQQVEVAEPCDDENVAHPPAPRMQLTAEMELWGTMAMEKDRQREADPDRQAPKAEMDRAPAAVAPYAAPAMSRAPESFGEPMQQVEDEEPCDDENVARPLRKAGRDHDGGTKKKLQGNQNAYKDANTYFTTPNWALTADHVQIDTIETWSQMKNVCCILSKAIAKQQKAPIHADRVAEGSRRVKEMKRKLAAYKDSNKAMFPQTCRHTKKARA